jgi:uncharacterized protein YbaR (Trm112 family)
MGETGIGKAMPTERIRPWKRPGWYAFAILDSLLPLLGFNLMDRKLLDLLCCPTTRQPLAMLEASGLSALNRAIGAGGVRRIDDSAQADALREALITRDRKTVYRVDDGIPVLLAEEGIATAQIDDFPAR